MAMNALKEDVQPTRQQLEADLARLEAEIHGLEGRTAATVTLIETLSRERLEAAKSLVLSGGGSGTVVKKQAALDEATTKLEALHALTAERKEAVVGVQARLTAVLRAEEDARHRAAIAAARAEAERQADEVIALWEKLAFSLGSLSLQIQRLAKLDRAAGAQIKNLISPYPRSAEHLTLAAFERGCTAVTLDQQLDFGAGAIVPALMPPSPAFAGEGVDRRREGLDAARVLELIARHEAQGGHEAA